MMKDNHVAGEGNAYYTLFREYDPDLGRWWRPDPIFQPWQSPYSAFDGNPIMLTDVWGLEVYKGAPPEGKAPTAPDGPNTPPEFPSPSIVPETTQSAKVKEGIQADYNRYSQTQPSYKPANLPQVASDATNQNGGTNRLIERVMPSLEKLNNQLSKVDPPTLVGLGIEGIKKRFWVNEQYADKIFEAAKNGQVVKFYKGGAQALLKKAKIDKSIVREFEKNLSIARGFKVISYLNTAWEAKNAVDGIITGYHNNDALLIVQSALDGYVTGIGVLGGPVGAGFAIFWGLGGKDLFWWSIEAMDKLPKNLIYRKRSEY